ncbi:UNVERIFIED_CONTAM: Retrovirus-related Pol polyprotein from transposon RE2 [Sesamum radiatum]|uniref:Retrovirus-related Pol polyprotein from transposon RE2 n=1 Tax=Sesamum radiatum TaxID=300843 RepID=A0AAW2JJ73_SESRA
MISNTASWVLDTSCGAHICNNLQVLERSRKLSKDEMILRLGDGKAVAAEAIGSLSLVYGYVYLMKYKSETFRRFKEYRLDMENQTGRKIKSLRSDRGADVMMSRLRNQMKNLSMIARHHLSLQFTLIVFQSSIGQLENLEHLRDKWFEAMKSEMDFMSSNQVWIMVDPPKGVRPVGSKWVYKCKLGADGKVTAFKARLVAKGYTQRPRVDFEETLFACSHGQVHSDTDCHSSMV